MSTEPQAVTSIILSYYYQCRLIDKSAEQVVNQFIATERRHIEPIELGLGRSSSGNVIRNQ